MIAAILLAAAAPASMAAGRAAAVDAVAGHAGFAGEIVVGDARDAFDHAYGSVAPEGGFPHRPGERWRLASVTKQVTATLAMQAVTAGRLSLDAPVAPVVKAPALGTLTLRQLLLHRSGLRNPDDTPDQAGMPAFYHADRPALDYCLTQPKSAPDGPFAYNNCDYLVVGALLDASGTPLHAAVRRLPGGFTWARPGERGVPGYVGGKPEPAVSLASFGAAGGLTGTARGLLAFDRALLAGTLLPAVARATMWTPDKHSYGAFGQWIFPGRLKGCAAPKRIVQRDGEIYGVQVRNFLFPDEGLSVILFTNRSSDDFPLGEVWEGKGFVYDLLSAAACP